MSAESAIHSVAGRPTAGELAHGLAELVTDALSAEDVIDLERLLAYSISHPTAPQLREARLGLLLELIDESGEIPGTSEYGELRSQREALGQHWPVHSVLVNAYGSWLGAVKAAMMLLAQRAPVAAQRQCRGRNDLAPGRPSKYSRGEVIAGIRDFHARHRTWPRFYEYLEWRLLKRKLARQRGHFAPRLASPKVINTLFGSFERAVELAARQDDS